jgi:CHASE3 domain sensor protein
MAFEMRAPIKTSFTVPGKRLLGKLGFLALGFAAVFNLGALWVSETSYNRIRATSSAVVETDQVLAGIERIRLHLLGAESAQRGFLVTGDAGSLGPYESAVGSLEADIAGLQEQVTDNPVHMSLLSTLQRDTKALLAKLGRDIELRQSAGFDIAREAAMTQSGRILMDTLRLTIDGMAQEEQRVRSASLRALRTDQVAIRLGVFAIALLNLVLVTFGVAFLWREIARQGRERAFLAERWRQLSEEVEARVSSNCVSCHAFWSRSARRRSSASRANCTTNSVARSRRPRSTCS